MAEVMRRTLSDHAAELSPKAIAGALDSESVPGLRRGVKGQRDELKRLAPEIGLVGMIGEDALAAEQIVARMKLVAGAGFEPAAFRL